MYSVPGTFESLILVTKVAKKGPVPEKIEK